MKALLEILKVVTNNNDRRDNSSTNSFIENSFKPCVGRLIGVFILFYVINSIINTKTGKTELPNKMSNSNRPERSNFNRENQFNGRRIRR